MCYFVKKQIFCTFFRKHPLKYRYIQKVRAVTPIGYSPNGMIQNEIIGWMHPKVLPDAIGSIDVVVVVIFWMMLVFLMDSDV